MKVLSILISAIILCGSVTAQSFEGVIEMRSTNAEEVADVTIHVAEGKHRIYFEGQTEVGPMKYSILVSNNGMQMISDATRTVYAIPQGSIEVKDNYTGGKVVRTGETSTIAGYKAEKVIIEFTDKKAVCWMSTQTVLSERDMPAVVRSNGIFGYLQKSNVKGIPLSISVVEGNNNVLFSQDVTGIRPQKVSSEKFQVPAGYQDFSQTLKEQQSQTK